MVLFSDFNFCVRKDGYVYHIYTLYHPFPNPVNRYRFYIVLTTFHIFSLSLSHIIFVCLSRLPTIIEVKTDFLFVFILICFCMFLNTTVLFFFFPVGLVIVDDAAAAAVLLLSYLVHFFLSRIFLHFKTMNFPILKF